MTPAVLFCFLALLFSLVELEHPYLLCGALMTDKHPISDFCQVNNVNINIQLPNHYIYISGFENPSSDVRFFILLKCLERLTH